MDRAPAQSHAAIALRTYEGRLHRAQRELDEAQRALSDAKIEFDAAERAHEAARHIYQAAQADRTRELGLDKVAPLTMSWIKALMAYSHAGSAELADAAASVGWHADPEAIRQQASRLAKAGVLERVDRGVYRVADRARGLVKTAPPGVDAVTTQPHVAALGTSQRSTGSEPDIETSDRDPSDHGFGPQSDARSGPASEYGHGGDDDMDDDPPF